jgi:hypothetical protein
MILHAASASASANVTVSASASEIVTHRAVSAIEIESAIAENQPMLLQTLAGPLCPPPIARRPCLALAVATAASLPVALPPRRLKAAGESHNAMHLLQ